MNLDDLRLIKYRSLDCKRFKHWVWIQDRRSGSDNKKKRKILIRYIETILGKLSDRWHYHYSNQNIFIFKLDDEKDLMIFLLKFKSN